ncbi:hypothetical protein DPMN_164464 [Dreissena polymorpha]|uniref:Uncharacterized protein n=1 Tax=Dreissena polymorpha TaxID=45954 RepID=A0A9D4EUA1_DREPO|nr:hypothetical protein DPMN_164464 [Dreissena polymorpha]
MSGKIGKAKRLFPQWTGPGGCSEKFNRFYIPGPIREKEGLCNHDRLKGCKLDNPSAWVVRERESCGFAEDVTEEQGEDKDLYTCPWCSAG